MHVMYDFETLGTGPDTMVISLGAVAFGKGGILGEALYHFDLEDQQRRGRSFTVQTLAWWMKQKEAARQVFWDTSQARLDFDDFLIHHASFISSTLAKKNETYAGLKVWGNGANFDISILENIYQSMNEETPWKFWNVWCFRTFNHMTKIKDRYKPKGVVHSALDDARYQAECCIEVLNGR